MSANKYMKCLSAKYCVGGIVLEQMWIGHYNNDIVTYIKQKLVIYEN